MCTAVFQIHWMRAARTDKGVSAACQVVSAKLMVEPTDTFADRVNLHLPKQVGFNRVNNSRETCSSSSIGFSSPARFVTAPAAAGRRQYQACSHPC